MPKRGNLRWRQEGCKSCLWVEFALRRIAEKIVGGDRLRVGARSLYGISDCRQGRTRDETVGIVRISHLRRIVGLFRQKRNEVVGSAPENAIENRGDSAAPP